MVTSRSNEHIHTSCYVSLTPTVEPQLSEPHGRHTIWPDNRGVRIDEGNRNSWVMGYRVGDN